MRSSIRIARIVQLVGVLLLVAAIVSCMSSGPQAGGYQGYLGFGLVLILGARIYEWLTKE